MEALIILLMIGAVLFAILAWNRIESLDRRLTDLEGRVQSPKDTPTSETRYLRTQTEAGQAFSDPSRIPPRSPVSSIVPPPTPPIAPSVVPKVEPIQPKQPSRTEQEWEALIGGKLLNRIGALALILGVGFFLKYAFDNNWISETARVIIGGIAGLALLFAGNHFHKKGFAIFAQGIVGAGIAILYLSVYATFNFYHLVSQPAAFVLMSVVTVVTFTQAMRHDAHAIAFLGWAGGFLTPFLLSTGECNQVGLFSYIAVLDFGLLALLAFKRNWGLLELFTLAATAIVYWAWRSECHATASLIATVVFATIFWSLFLVSEIVHHVRRAAETSRRQVTSVLNSIMLFLILWSELNRSYHDRLGLVILLIGIAYFLVGMSMRRHLSEVPRFLNQYLVTAIAFLVIATAFQFHYFELSMVWSLEAAALVGCGLFWKRPVVWQAALGLFALVVVSLMYQPKTVEYEPVKLFVLLFNQRALTLGVLAASMLGSSILFRSRRDDTTKVVSDILNVGACALLFGLATVETLDYFRQKLVAAGGTEMPSDRAFVRNLALVAIWAIYSLPLLWLGLHKKLWSVAFVGLGVIEVAIVMGFIAGFGYRPIEQFSIFLNIRAATLLLLIGMLYLHMKRIALARGFEDWAKNLLPILRLTLVLLLLYLFTVETWAAFDRPIAALAASRNFAGATSAIDRLRDLQQLTLSGVWLAFSVALMVFGLWARRRQLRIMSIVLFGATILKIFIYDLSFLDTLYRIFSFIGLGLILLAVSYAYQRFKSIILEQGPKAV